MRGKISRSTLADANETRNFRIYQGLGCAMRFSNLSQIQGGVSEIVAPGRILRRELEGMERSGIAVRSSDFGGHRTLTPTAP
jgi:hypothetical protein